MVVLGDWLLTLYSYIYLKNRYVSLWLQATNPINKNPFFSLCCKTQQVTHQSIRPLCELKNTTKKHSTATTMAPATVTASFVREEWARAARPGCGGPSSFSCPTTPKCLRGTNRRPCLISFGVSEESDVARGAYICSSQCRRWLVKAFCLL